MSSISSNHGIFSTHTARTLKAERRQQEPKKSFWDSFGKLTLGQKVGRTVANLGVGGAVGAGAGAGAVYGLGLGLGLATGGIALAGVALGMLGFWGITAAVRSVKESARVARQEECRPRENRVLNSTDTVRKGEEQTDTGIPMKNTTVLGAEARKECAKALMYHVVQDGVLSKGPFTGLSRTFIGDLTRSDFSLETSDGKVSNFGRQKFIDQKIDIPLMKDEQKQAVIEQDFKQVIAGDPALAGNGEKIARWQEVASRFMSQTTLLKPQYFAVMASGLHIAEGKNFICKYNLKFEPGGDSAILECIETGGVNGITKFMGVEGQRNNVAVYSGWNNDAFALDYGVDRDATYLKKITVLRITLEQPSAPEEGNDSGKAVSDGMGLELLSHSSQYELSMMNQEQYDVMRERVNNPPLIVEQQAPIVLTDALVELLLDRLDAGVKLMASDTQRIAQLKSELLEGKRQLTPENLEIFAKHLETTKMTPEELRTWQTYLQKADNSIE